jgi:tryptophan halogenase
MFHHAHVGFHIENKKLVSYLEARCRDFDVVIIDCTVSEVVKGPHGIQQLILESGDAVAADLFIDASGFRSELIGRALEVPYTSYESTLFCDRAVIGGWHRTDEPVKPYTVAETMDAGWAWQIEHETFINRGYVYSSRFISDEDALAEFLRKNPKVSNEPRVVKFRTGRYSKMWVGNVIGIGNSSGFVEPLEASALQVIILQCRTLADILNDSLCDVPDTTIALYNTFVGQAWDDVRDFLAVHYRFNTRLETPFWQAARNDVALHGAEPLVDFYRENGPSGIGRTVLLHQNNPYGLEGYFAMLVGQKVPHAKPYQPTEAERRTFDAHRKEFRTLAKRGLDVKQSLESIRRPGWMWK